MQQQLPLHTFQRFRLNHLWGYWKFSILPLKCQKYFQLHILNESAYNYKLVGLPVVFCQDTDTWARFSVGISHRKEDEEVDRQMDSLGDSLGSQNCISPADNLFPISFLLRTPLMLLLPYWPRSVRVKHQLPLQTAINTMLKNP